MTDPAGDVLQRSVERLGTFAGAAFGVGLRLSAPEEGALQTDSAGALRVSARQVRCARAGERLLLAQSFPGDGDSPPPAPHERADVPPGLPSTHLLDAFLDMAADLLGVLADAQTLPATESQREHLWRDLLGAPTIVGVSGPARALRAALPAAANSREPLFLSGEPGSGRGEVAAAVHRAGPRAAGPFIAENLAALPETLRETEIFGAGDTPGLLAAAAGGTLYLAAVEHLPGRAQERLLGHLAGVDAAGEPAPARIIAAADADLGECALRGRFRRDLADRLTTLRLAVPTLRERPEDIPIIAVHLLRRRAAALGETPAQITADALDSLKKRPWAGNVRELDEELARAASGRTMIRADDLSVLSPRTGRGESAARGSLLREAVCELETGLLSRALADTNWNKSRAARILGLSRLGLQKKIDRYGIDRRR